MKRWLLMVLLCSVSVGLSGCFISIKGDACRSDKAVHHPEPDPAVAEIEAVKMLSSEAARLNVLRTIAARPGLSPQARIHLIETTRLLSDEASREEVLMELANNPPVLPPQPQQPCDEQEDD